MRGEYIIDKFRGRENHKIRRPDLRGTEMSGIYLLGQYGTNWLLLACTKNAVPSAFIPAAIRFWNWDKGHDKFLGGRGGRGRVCRTSF